MNPNATSALTLTQVEKVIIKLALKGNPRAVAVLEDSVALSLVQRFSDAFGVKFEKEQRLAFQSARDQHRKQFHPLLTSWLKEDAGGDNSLVDWGKEIQMFKAVVKLPSKSVDQYTTEELQQLNKAETVYHAYRTIGLTHAKALTTVKEAL